ncbi:MAG: NADH-quinone oxidoreductase subunit N [Anaerosomatales bacterium]|nr:NADH-quinone oxidoreductase subunit N [Anaerosomatales bacterium]
MSELAVLLPEALVLVGALAALFAERLPGGDRTAARLGWVLAAAAALSAAAIGVREPIAGGTLAFDALARDARVAVAALAALYLLWLSGSDLGRVREMAAFAQFAALGGMLMASAQDLATLFIAIELGTMPAYVMMGYERSDARTLEGSLKYYLLSMTTSLVMLYGFSLLFGLAGTTRFDHAGAMSPEGLLGSFAVVFALTGLFAKLSAAPFHFWTPDAYAGAPASAVAFVSTVPKVAGVAALLRLTGALSAGELLPLYFGAAALASMLLGNLGAYPQRDVRRLMAYSGIAHSGYVLLAVGVGSASALGYAVIYAIPSLAVMLVAAEEGTAVDDWAGLFQRRPAVAWALVVLLLSLVGVPPMAGFFGKLAIFGAALDAGRTALVVVAAVMSVVSAGYYFKLIRAAFFTEEAPAPSEERARPSLASGVAIAIATAATLLVTFGVAELLSLPGIRG